MGLSRVQTRRSKSIALDVTPVCTYTVFSPSPHRTPTPDNNDSPTHPAPGFGIQFSVLRDRPRGAMYIRARGPLSGYLEWGPPAARRDRDMLLTLHTVSVWRGTCTCPTGNCAPSCRGQCGLVRSACIRFALPVGKAWGMWAGLGLGLRGRPGDNSEALSDTDKADRGLAPSEVDLVHQPRIEPRHSLVGGDCAGYGNPCTFPVLDTLSGF